MAGRTCAWWNMKESKPPKSTDLKSNRDFLFPRMPGAFKPSIMRKKDIGFLRDRYIQVLSASMGNHGMAMFYCAWSQEQFEAAMTDAFAKRIEGTRALLADRAAFIMHKAMGLVAGDEPTAPPTVTAAMAKVVESFGSPAGDKKAPKKGYKLIVDGLARPGATAHPGAVPERRGPGRPRKEPPAAQAGA